MATTTVGLGSSSPALSPGPTIELCGRLCIERDGHRVESGLPGRQGRLLFAYLVLNRSRPISRDELIDAIWWQAQPGAPAAALSALLSRLRRLLGAHWLEGRGELRLALPDDAWVDVEVAREAAALAQAASAEGEYARARGPATLVVQLADRGLLPGLDAPWLDERRRELEELALCSLECIAQAGAPLRGPALAAGESAARRMIERAPYRESGHRRLMEILEARGDVAEALGVYERLRCLLRDELGAAPAPELQAVHERLLHAGDRRSAARRGREGTLGRRLLGRDELHFVGRRSELDLFDGLFVDDPARSVVLIHGPGGIGKSTLLREVARRGARHGWTPRLVEGRELLPVPNALEEALAGVREDERPLLLFDTYERIQAIDSYLRRCLLPALPERAIVVIAGRRPPSVGWSEGGWENLTAELELQRLSPDEAIELLRVHGITNELATQRILAWADGSPLALALAAARGGGPPSIE